MFPSTFVVAFPYQWSIRDTVDPCSLKYSVLTDFSFLPTKWCSISYWSWFAFPWLPMKLSSKNNIPQIRHTKIAYIRVVVPCLVWLSGLSACLRTKGLTVRFPVTAHAWVAHQAPSRGCARGNHTLMFLSLSPSFHLSLKINK